MLPEVFRQIGAGRTSSREQEHKQWKAFLAAQVSGHPASFSQEILKS